MTRRSALRAALNPQSLHTLEQMRLADDQVLLVHPELTPLETQHLLRQCSNPPFWPEVQQAEGSGEVWVSTSGTSGQSRIVRLSWQAIETSARAVWKALGGAQGDHWLCPLPLAHVAGLAVVERCRVGKGVPRLLKHRGSGPHLLHALRDPAIQFASLVPTQLKRLVSALNGASPPPLKALLVGGAATPPELLAQARSAGLPVVCSYGLTEAGSTVAITALDDALNPQAPGGQAKLLPGFEGRIVDGELQLRGAAMFRGYLGAASRSPEEWFSTGDEAEMSGKTVRLTGRKGSSYKRGGEWIDPLEIEGILTACPDISEIAVVPEADPDLGFRTLALVVPVSLEGDIESRLNAFAAQHLARHKRPARWEFRRQLPRGPLGKLLRHQLVK
ncbi:MAG TPA: hypothetical protein DEB46_07240 [Myxococcales bacterium]|nr:hypothetical protein [Myxococcales bacterium]HBU48091.1 hypothetical protein [Myxococcales bacterium]